MVACWGDVDVEIFKEDCTLVGDVVVETHPSP